MFENREQLQEILKSKSTCKAASQTNNQVHPFIILKITNVYVKMQKEINSRSFMTQQENGRNLNTMSDIKLTKKRDPLRSLFDIYEINKGSTRIQPAPVNEADELTKFKSTQRFHRQRQ